MRKKSARRRNKVREKSWKHGTEIKLEKNTKRVHIRITKVYKLNERGLQNIENERIKQIYTEGN